MSNSLAIAAVTVILSDLLINQVNQEDPTFDDLKISSKPPDLARGTEIVNQLNLFLYQTTLNSAWRNSDPRQVNRGGNGQPPLGLTLHYLITAYGIHNEDIASHLLLGRAMRVFHDHSLLNTDNVKDLIEGSDLSQQIEKIRIVPQPLSLEEMSKLWTIFQAPYRISAAYEVSVVLIDSKKLAKAPLPVLTIGPPLPDPLAGVIVQPSLPIVLPTATLLDLKFPSQESSAELGDPITLSGHHLVFDEKPQGTSVKLVLKHKLFAVAKEIIPDQATTNEIKFSFSSNQPTDWPAGAYTVYASITDNLKKKQVSNELPFLLAPKIAPLPVASDKDKTTITITVTPQIWPEQQAFLLLGSLQIPAQPHPNKTDNLTFIIQPAPKGTFFIRLRVDGIDSHLIQLVKDKLQFNPALQVTIP
jgi:hypothetical protein